MKGTKLIQTSVGDFEAKVDKMFSSLANYENVELVSVINWSNKKLFAIFQYDKKF